MRNCQCSKCEHSVELTTETVEKKWVARGYDSDYWGYFVKCPKCKTEKEVAFTRLPFKLMWYFLKHR